MVRNGRERRREERAARSSILDRGGRRSIEERGGRSSNDNERGGRRNEKQGNAIMPGIALVRDRFAGVGVVSDRLRHCKLKVAMPARKGGESGGGGEERGQGGDRAAAAGGRALTSLAYPPDLAPLCSSLRSPLCSSLPA